MTSARRAARAAARVAPVASGPAVPPELLDPGHQVWHDQRAYHSFMAAHDWTLPPAERIGYTTAPTNRRSAAAAGWAHDNGVLAEGHRGVDWHRLRSWGLIN